MRSETKPSQDEEKNGQEPLLPPIQPVIDFGSVVIKNSRAAIHCLTIAGQIEGHMLLPNTQKATKYEHVLPLLAYLEESEDIDGVLFLLNTVGGDVEAGLAIAELISGMKKPTVSLVLGGGHSIGVPLAVAPMVTMIAPSASMTIHPVRTSGTIIAAPQTYQYFERLQERIVRFVTKNSRIGRDEFLRLMMDTQDLASDVGSVLYGEEAVACGLIQRLGSLSDALDALYRADRRKEEVKKPRRVCRAWQVGQIRRDNALRGVFCCGACHLTENMADGTVSAAATSCGRHDWFAVGRGNVIPTVHVAADCKARSLSEKPVRRLFRQF